MELALKTPEYLKPKERLKILSEHSKSLRIISEKAFQLCALSAIERYFEVTPGAFWIAIRQDKKVRQAVMDGEKTRWIVETEKFLLEQKKFKHYTEAYITKEPVEIKGKKTVLTNFEYGACKAFFESVQKHYELFLKMFEYKAFICRYDKAQFKEWLELPYEKKLFEMKNQRLESSDTMQIRKRITKLLDDAGGVDDRATGSDGLPADLTPRLAHGKVELELAENQQKDTPVSP